MILCVACLLIVVTLFVTIINDKISNLFAHKPFRSFLSTSQRVHQVAHHCLTIQKVPDKRKMSMKMIGASLLYNCSLYLPKVDHDVTLSAISILVDMIPLAASSNLRKRISFFSYYVVPTMEGFCSYCCVLWCRSAYDPRTRRTLLLQHRCNSDCQRLGFHWRCAHFNQKRKKLTKISLRCCGYVDDAETREAEVIIWYVDKLKVPLVLVKKCT